MKRKKTVLILGASAGRPYGFPTGPDLASLIVQGLTVGPQPILMVRLSRCNFSISKIETFRQKLLGLEAFTVDRFLEIHPDLRDD